MSPLVKKLSWALACSLALNLFLLGFGAARWFKHGRHHRQEVMRDAGPDLERKLPRRWFGEHGPNLRAQHQEVARTRREVVEALTAEPFDAQALEQALAALRETTAAGQLRLHDALLDSAKRASREERVQLAHSRFLRDGPPPPGARGPHHRLPEPR